MQKINKKLTEMIFLISVSLIPQVLAVLLKQYCFDITILLKIFLQLFTFSQQEDFLTFITVGVRNPLQLFNYMFDA